MALDPSYICSSDIEGVFLDKLTGFPLAAGTIDFFIDGSSTPKAVYKTTGSPPSGFVSLGTSITLNSIGGYDDSGQSIVIYYYPYDADGNLELYKCVVKNSGGVLQETREAWPPLAVNLQPSTNPDTSITNYIPNGQFLAHNDGSSAVTVTSGGNDVKEIAQGGWSFQKTTGGTGTYTVSFNTESTTVYPTGLNDAPPFSVNIVGSAVGTETVHDLVIQWPDVNKFSRKSTTGVFNLALAAKTNSGGAQTFTVYLTLNNGSGGTVVAPILQPTSITVPAFPASYAYFNVPISMPDNSGSTVGAGSYVALSIRTPASGCDVRFTDFAFTLGNGTLQQFPITPNADMLSQGVAGWMPTPNPDGSDLYLPLVLTPTGMTFDHSIVGQIIGKDQTSAYAVNNELLLDGSTYIYSGYSTLGIPYSRLGDYLILNSPSGVIGGAQWDANVIPQYGTGSNFVTLFNVTASLTTQFFVQINTPSAGGSASSSGGAITIAATSANIYYTATVNSVPTASYYWSFVDGAVNHTYNVWYSVDGAGTAPATPTGANIEVALVTSDTVVTTIAKTLAAVNQYQFLLINARGYFWRGLDTGTSVDPSSATRSMGGIVFNGTNFVGANLGSLEAQSYLAHTHLAISTTTLAAGATSAGAGVSYAAGASGAQTYSNGQLLTTTTVAAAGGSPAGGLETRPVNLALNWFIKY